MEGLQLQRDNLSGEKRRQRTKRKKEKEDRKRRKDRRGRWIDSKIGGSHLWKRNPRRSRPFLSHCRENSRAKAGRLWSISSPSSSRLDSPSPWKLLVSFVEIVRNQGLRLLLLLLLFLFFHSFLFLAASLRRRCKVFPRKKCYCCRWPRYPRSLSCPTSISSDFWWRDRVGCPSFRVMLLFRVWSLELSLCLSLSLSQGFVILLFPFFSMFSIILRGSEIDEVKILVKIRRK